MGSEPEGGRAVQKNISGQPEHVTDEKERELRRRLRFVGWWGGVRKCGREGGWNGFLMGYS